jgi:hypothetical protein
MRGYVGNRGQVEFLYHGVLVLLEYFFCRPPENSKKQRKSTVFSGLIDIFEKRELAMKFSFLHCLPIIQWGIAP